MCVHIIFKSKNVCHKVREEAYKRAIAAAKHNIQNGELAFDAYQMDSPKQQSPKSFKRSNDAVEEVFMHVPEPLIEPGKSNRDNKRDESEFIRYNSFLLRSHLTSLFTML